jgi:non-specific serine/threonine protein kinase
MRGVLAVLLVATVISACVSGPSSSATTPPSLAASTAASRASGVATSATPAPAAWRGIADIPTARSEVAAAVSQQLSKVFVIGGFGGPSRVELYDAEVDRWTRAPDLPVGVDHPMAAAVEGLQSSAPQGVFVFGGYAGSATARSFRFDATAARWEEIAAMPGPRAAAAAVAIGGSIFIVGGADGGRLVAPTYEYNLGTRQWRTVAAIPTPRDHLAAAALDGRICAVGGRRLSMSENLATFECYDPRTDTWERLPDAPTARGGLGAAQYDRRVYVAGGEQPSGTYREVDIFDARTNAWTRGPDLPTPRHGLGVVVAQPTKALSAAGILVMTPARLLVLSGGPTPGGSQTGVCEVMDLR